jgi:pyruvate/2-oxoglutarate/acetoin dehydrogenase E1 component
MPLRPPPSSSSSTTASTVSCANVSPSPTTISEIVPSNAYDAKGLMIEAIRDDNPGMCASVAYRYCECCAASL